MNKESKDRGKIINFPVNRRVDLIDNNVLMFGSVEELINWAVRSNSSGSQDNRERFYEELEKDPEMLAISEQYRLDTNDYYD